MSYRTFIVNNNPLEVLNSVWNAYGIERAKISDEKRETITIYPRGIIGNAEAQIHVPKEYPCSKIMLIGEIEEINNTKTNLEMVVKAPLQLQIP